MSTKRLFSMVIVILLGCAGNMFATTQDDTLKSKTAVDSVSTGNALYLKSCARCHKLKDPARYTMAQWPGLVNKMQKRSKITDQEKAMILSYLATKAKK